MTHRQISLIKSVMRIIGFAIMIVNLPLAVVILVLAEALGIQEEKGDRW